MGAMKYRSDAQTVRRHRVMVNLQLQEWFATIY
jgi:hypothetical protein